MARAGMGIAVFMVVKLCSVCAALKMNPWGSRISSDLPLASMSHKIASANCGGRLRSVPRQCPSRCGKRDSIRWTASPEGGGHSSNGMECRLGKYPTASGPDFFATANEFALGEGGVMASGPAGNSICGGGGGSGGAASAPPPGSKSSEGPCRVIRKSLAQEAQEQLGAKPSQLNRASA